MTKSWNQDDHRLVRRMLKGDEEAFQAFFEDHFPPLYRFALRRLNDPDAAGEVAQSALCQAINKLATWRGEAALRTWLFTFCRHQLSRHLAKYRRTPLPVGLPEDSPEIRSVLEALAVVEGQGPEADLRAKELAALVQLTLDHLPVRHSTVLRLKYLQDLSVKEIAHRLNLGTKAVESLLTRARQTFRDGFSSICGESASVDPRQGRTAWAFTNSAPSSNPSTR